MGIKRIILAVFFISSSLIAQNNSKEAKILLDEVSTKMGAYKNMTIGFSQTLINKDAGITNDPPIRGKIILSGEKYNLEYLGNNFIFDGNKLVVINKEEKEISITKGDMEDEDGFVYPSKLLTFYKKGYTYEMGKLKNSKGRKVQHINLTPIDSNSDIVKVQLVVDARTKHICELIQIGSNGAKTTFTINTFKSNQPISESMFSFDKGKYEKQGYLID
ncbi:MAG: outer membrane lipoprotein carrier protein LolA [Tenacibaculum sp.]|nr:outer membrane lipoprotein carrier protein LolA [Tenacibaculum sp.]